jgi:hypothetical protein
MTQHSVLEEGSDKIQTNHQGYCLETMYIYQVLVYILENTTKHVIRSVFIHNKTLKNSP